VQTKAVWLIGLLFASALPGAALRGQVRPVVAVSEVQKGRLERTIRQAVTLYPFEKVTVYARATGYAREVLVDLGDTVEAGTTLVVLDMPKQEAELAAATAGTMSAKAKVEKARAQVTLKEAILKLTTELFKKGGRNQFQLDEVDAELKLAQAALKLAQAQVLEAQAEREEVVVMASFARVVAPFTGRITKRMVDTGALVREGTSSGASALFEVQRIDKLRCRLDIPERDAILILESFGQGGLSVSLTFDSLQGRILDLGPKKLSKKNILFAKELHPQSHHMLSEIILPNEDESLLPGLFGKVTLHALGVSAPTVVLVPNPAIQAPRKAKPFVFVVTSSGATSSAKMRPVELGITDGSLTEIVKGLESGERVIVRGAAPLLADPEQPQEQEVEVGLENTTFGKEKGE